MAKKLKGRKKFQTKFLLHEIPTGSKILCTCSDDSTYFIYDHPDGMYSYCVTEKGNIVHIGLMQPVEKIKDHYILTSL